jgi:restriction system protein
VLWAVKGGRHGEYEQLMLDKNLVLYDWPEFPDLRQCKTRDDIEAMYLKEYPDASPQRRGNHVGQLWAFANKMQAGDLVVVRMKTKGAIAIAEVKGPYEHRTDLA